jgi:hypothetical protein
VKSIHPEESARGVCHSANTNGVGLLEVDRSSLEWVRANVVPLGEPDGELIDAVLE